MTFGKVIVYAYEVSAKSYHLRATKCCITSLVVAPAVPVVVILPGFILLLLYFAVGHFNTPN